MQVAHSDNSESGALRGECLPVHVKLPGAPPAGLKEGGPCCQTVAAAPQTVTILAVTVSEDSGFINAGLSCLKWHSYRSTVQPMKSVVHFLRGGGSRG